LHTANSNTVLELFTGWLLLRTASVGCFLRIGSLVDCYLNTDSWTESASYITTDGQSASLSWIKAPIWGLRQDFYYCQTLAGLLIWGALSDERTGLSFTIAPGLASVDIFGSDSLGIRDHILLSPIRDFPFPSPPTTRRVTVEVFDPTSTRE
jgi:hypothetical protein